MRWWRKKGRNYQYLILSWLLLGDGYNTVVHECTFIPNLLINMKAYEVVKTDAFTWRKESRIFKHYENALNYKMRKRKENMSRWHSENRFWQSRYSDKISNIKTIEVPDDYWKKDFGEYLDIGWNFWLGKKPKTDWWQKHTEEEYLQLQLGIFREHNTHDYYKNRDIKFVREDIDWVLGAKFPKWERVKQLRDCFFSCWRILRRSWEEYRFWEQMRWMYEDEFNEYCERMDELQEELNKELVR